VGEKKPTPAFYDLKGEKEHKNAEIGEKAKGGRFFSDVEKKPTGDRCGGRGKYRNPPIKRGGKVLFNKTLPGSGRKKRRGRIHLFLPVGKKEKEAEDGITSSAPSPDLRKTPHASLLVCREKQTGRL